MLEEQLRRELQTAFAGVYTLDVEADYVTTWGYDENVYLALCNASPSSSSPFIIRTTAGREVETILTYSQAMAVLPATSPGGAPQTFIEIVSILKCPDGTILATTHYPVSILRKRPGFAWENVLSTDFLSSYGLAINWRGDIFCSARNRAAYAYPTQPVERAIYRSLDRGSTWTKVYTQAVDDIYDITCYRDIIMVGAGGGVIIRSIDHGATFAPVAMVAGAHRHLTPLGNGKWLTALTGNLYEIMLELSTDDGATWNLMANTLPVPITSAANHLSSSSGVIIASPLYSNLLSISQDEGATWQVLPLPWGGGYGRGVYLAGRTAFASMRLEAGNPFYGVGNRGKLAIVRLTDLVPAQPQSFLVLGGWPFVPNTVAASATSTLADCRSLMGNGKSMSLTVSGTYNAAAILGMKVHVRTSYDCTNYDDPGSLLPADRAKADWDVWTPAFTAGATIRQSKVYDEGPRFIKVLIENLDAGQSITNVLVTATMRG